MDKLDCIAFGPHPDDVELFCGGTLAKLKSAGYKTAIVDLTQGELSTNGDIATRQKEAADAAKILKIDKRINLNIPDGNIVPDVQNRFKIISIIRAHQPEICLIPYWEDRHPDHCDASLVIQKAIFESGLRKVECPGEAYRPKAVFYYMLHHNFNPTFVVDITHEMETKNEAIRAYSSQFSSPGDGVKPTHINQVDFLEFLTNRASCLGYEIGEKYGEGFYYKGIIKIDNLMSIFT